MKHRLFGSAPFALALAAALMLTASTWAAPGDHSLAPLKGDKPFNVADGKGRWVALHFLTGASPADASRAVAFAARAPEVAGVRHVFLVPLATDQPAPMNFDALHAYRDPEGKFAAEFKLANPPAAWTVVVLAPNGAERFRVAGAAGADPSFADFAGRMERATTSSALGEYNLGDGKLALGGYDPVAYFTESAAKQGNAAIASKYHGATYHFASRQHRELFAADPQKYLPTYGGWCATAMAEGDKVDIDPETFKVTNGRLFLFYNGWLGNALKSWNKDEANLEKQADDQWKTIAKE
jgi:YHS domain-containing protein